MTDTPDITAIDTGTAEHYQWGGTCDGWHLVHNPQLSVIEERMPPGAAERKHAHQHARQFFYVLAGELTLLLDNGTVILSPHRGFEISPGIFHQARNPSPVEVRFLVISQPPSHGDRIEAAD